MNEEHILNPNMGINVGMKAPIIKKIDVFENLFNLTEALDKYRGIVIDFSRGAWWFYWKKQFTKLNQNIIEFEKRNIMLVAISTDRIRPLKKLAEKENYKFKVISDADAKISKEYKVFGKPIDYDMIKAELAIPSTYLIDSTGMIVWRYIGTKTNRPSIEAILEAIDNNL